VRVRGGGLESYRVVRVEVLRAHEEGFGWSGPVLWTVEMRLGEK
jgi:hypothetical protein